MSFSCRLELKSRNSEQHCHGFGAGAAVIFALETSGFMISL